MKISNWSIQACILVFCCMPAFLSSQEHPKTSQELAGQVVPPQMFDPEAMDLSVNPCEDFYEYACGTWRKNNPIPSDQVFWARYNQLGEYNREVLHKILEGAAAAPASLTAKIVGDFYASCMDEASANRKGYSPLKPELTRITAISNRKQLIEALAHLQSVGVPVMFEFRAEPDLHDATREIAAILQGGLGLPDRDYYINQNDRAKETRTRYLAHIAAMLRFAGEEQIQVESKAAAILEIETRLAEVALDRVRMRDPKSRDHKMQVRELDALAPNLLLPFFLKGAGSPTFAEINVAPPEFFQKLSAALDSIPLDNWKAYLKWHLIQANARFLSQDFANEDFDFERRYMNGQREPEPRWKMCVSSADRLLGQALGRVYVEQTFSSESKKRILTMVNLEEETLAEDIRELTWMTAETRQQALTKLKAITNKIGYPERWLDYRKLKINRDDLLTNVSHARQFQVQYNLAKIGAEVNKREWTITTPTVNAYYYTPENSINFPAGVLQPPLFDANKDDAVNFGAIGWLIGHELTHGFDDEGSKFDGQGNLTNWWTQSDREEFEKRTSCLADQYQQFIVVDDIHLNGRLTLGENTADNGGIRIAFAALHKAMENSGASQKPIDGFTADQRFFISFAQQWCANITPERLRVISRVDPHAPVRFRTLGTLRNDADFAKAFGCKAGQSMVSVNSCRVW